MLHIAARAQCAPRVLFGEADHVNDALEALGLQRRLEGRPVFAVALEQPRPSGKPGAIPRLNTVTSCPTSSSRRTMLVLMFPVPPMTQTRMVLSFQ